MYFLKQLSFAVILGFALADARALRFNPKREVGTSGVTAGSDQARSVRLSTGEKLAGQALFGRGVEINHEASKEQAAECKEALNQLRKRSLRKSKRADDDDDDSDDEEEDEDMSDDMLGPMSQTVKTGKGKPLTKDQAEEEEVTKFGTFGLNSCSGVLIVGDDGYTIAHLKPIEPSDDDKTKPDENSKEEFKGQIQSIVERDYNAIANNLGNAVMYIMTPTTNMGEEEELVAAAERLQIQVSKNKYDVVENSVMDEPDYDANERGTIYVECSDPDHPVVKVNGDDPAEAEDPTAESMDESMDEDDD
ncbi:MAG: hypothetical protein Q9219_001602 [cf. Caloplaca sp. 3 TL-2023]